MSDRKLLLVDDEANILKALQRLLRRDGYTILLANNGAEALQLLLENNIGVIIADHRMPAMTGTELLSQVKDLYPDTTRIVLSGFSDIDSITEVINQGNIYKFLAKPWDDAEIRTTVQEAFERFELRAENTRLTKELKQANAALEQENVEASSLLEQVVNHNSDAIIVVNKDRKVIFSNPSALSLLIDHYRVLEGDQFAMPFQENQIIQQRLQRPGRPDLLLEVRSIMIKHEGQLAFLVSLHDISAIECIYQQKQRSEANLSKVIQQVFRIINANVMQIDVYTALHEERVSCLAAAIGEQMELNDEEIDSLKIAGLIHDIGKAYVPLDILNRPGPMTEAERLIVQQHTGIGEALVSKVDLPWPIKQIVGQHHERLDGSGYPLGLSGQHIILESRIMAVADVAAAMVSDRPYRNAYSIDEVFSMLKQKSGIKFDADVVTACIKVSEQGCFTWFK
ncbi:MAG: response regulator [Methyloprofundus sp.]|nr:response regulator [Methyloprofundus sp.]